MVQLNKIGRYKTRIIKQDRWITVMYFNIPIVKFSDKMIALNNGGQITQSTKNRMNQISNYYELGYQVHINHKIMNVKLLSNGNRFNFHNNIVILPKT